MSEITFKLNNNIEIPALGLGTFKSAEGEVYQAVKEAIKIGYRHIDCAWIYGNENEIGRAISDAINEGIITREDLFITSKLWNNAHGKGKVTPAFNQSLSALKLDYIDLYLIHWPISFIADVEYPMTNDHMIYNNFSLILESWREMEDLVSEGKIKSIGVSNFSIPKLQRLLDQVTIKPVTNQVELHPYLQQQQLVGFCQEHQMIPTAYSPLGSKARNVDDKGESALEHPSIQQIAMKHSVTEAQVLLAWAINRGTIVIPKSVNLSRLKDNFNAQFIKLDDHDMNEIRQLDKNLRYIDGNFCSFEGSKFSVDALWNE